jgi:hypothetical protein
MLSPGGASGVERLNSTRTLIQTTTTEAPHRTYVLHWAGCSQEDDQLLRQRCQRSDPSRGQDCRDYAIKTPVRAPQANAFCERLIGTVRRECLDYLPIDERHLRRLLREWVAHYNRGRPHSSLGPGIPNRTTPSPPRRTDRHHLAPSERVTSTSVLGGLHHEFGLEPSAA